MNFNGSVLLRKCVQARKFLQDMVEVTKDLNEQQRQAVTHGSGPLLVVAGAGTGKTTVITRRIVRMLQGEAGSSHRQGGVPLQREKSEVRANDRTLTSNLQPPTPARTSLRPEEVLALTFTDKAAQEMEDRVSQLLPHNYAELWISTFHAFAERLLRRHAVDAGLSSDFRLLSPTESWFLMKQHLDRFALDYYRPRGNPTKFLHALLGHFSRAKDEGVGVAAYRQYAETLKFNADATLPEGEHARVFEIAEAYRIYQEILAQENALDFGDLLLSLRDLLTVRPRILKLCQEQFQHILVDEFQDTNAVQYELVKLLAGTSRNLTVVADDDQAIYRWRGAGFNNVLQFVRDYPDATLVVLEHNYRSTQNILDSAYRFIQHNNPNRLEDAIARGAVSSFQAITKKLLAADPRPGTILHLHASTEEEEARLVIEKIVELRAADPALLFSDIAVLVRSNADAESFVRAAAVAELPVEYMSARGLYRKPLVLDSIAYLRVVADVSQSRPLWRLLVSPLFTLGAADLAILSEALHKRADLSLYAIITTELLRRNLSEAGRQQLTALLRWIEQGEQEARGKSVGTVLLNFLERSGFLKQLTATETREHLGALMDLRQFFTVIDRFQGFSEDPSVRSFVEYLDLALAAADEGTLEIEALEGPDAVRILTVHSAKGLEFEHVFLVHLVDRRFPTSERALELELPEALLARPENAYGQSGSQDEHIQEERRLFYVGMTRAKQGLYFTSAEDYGGARKKKLSRFLFEVGIASPEAPPKPTGKTRFDSEGITNQNSRFKHRDATPNLQPTTYNLQPPDTFSYTQLKAYETCPLQYKFAHVLHLPRRGSATLSFGQTIHRTLEKFFSLAREGEQESLFEQPQAVHSEQPSAGDNPVPITRYSLPAVRVPPLATLLQLYDECWIPQWYSSAKEADAFRLRGKQMLQAFYVRHEQDGWPTIWAIEQPFLLNLDGIRLKGKIDRIDLVVGDGKRQTVNGTKEAVAIVDYKTGRSPKDDRGVDHDQLLLYQLAVSRALRATPAKLSYEFLEDGKVVSFLGSPAELAELERNVKGVVAEIRSGKFAPKPSRISCSFCDFKEICEYRVL